MLDCGDNALSFATIIAVLAGHRWSRNLLLGGAFSYSDTTVDLSVIYLGMILRDENRFISN